MYSEGQFIQFERWGEVNGGTIEVVDVSALSGSTVYLVKTPDGSTWVSEDKIIRG